MIAPGVDLLGAAYERDAGRWECEPGGETLCLRLHPDVVRRYIQDEAYRFDLETDYSVRDDALVNAVFALAEEMQHQLPNGVLYAEGALADDHRLAEPPSRGAAGRHRAEGPRAFAGAAGQGA